MLFHIGLCFLNIQSGSFTVLMYVYGHFGEQTSTVLVFVLTSLGPRMSAYASGKKVAGQ